MDLKVASRLSLVFMPILSLVLVLMIGYIGLQTEGMLNGYMFDFSGVPVTSVAKRFPWELQMATVLVSFGAVVVYGRFAGNRKTKVFVFCTLGVAAVLSVMFYETIHSTRTNLLAMAFVVGGNSPLTLGLIAAVAAEMIYGKRHVERDAA